MNTGYFSLESFGLLSFLQALVLWGQPGYKGSKVEPSLMVEMSYSCLFLYSGCVAQLTPHSGLGSAVSILTNASLGEGPRFHVWSSACLHYLALCVQHVSGSVLAHVMFHHGDQ